MSISRWVEWHCQCDACGVLGRDQAPAVQVLGEDDRVKLFAKMRERGWRIDIKGSSVFTYCPDCKAGVPA
jgi:hypothetical protein